jgi:hypothetical protein
VTIPYKEAALPLLDTLTPTARAIGAGFTVGEAVSLAANRKRGVALQGIALGGFLVALVVPLLLAPVFFLRPDLFALAGFIVGIALAIARVR